jgi:penicillin-binding protein 1A
VGFTNNVTVAVWVGYDNAAGKRRTLGAGNTGSRVALPIFQSIIEGAWSSGLLPKVALAPPSAEAARALVSVPIDLHGGQRLSASRGAFVEYLRRDEAGEIKETRLRLVGHEDPFRRKVAVRAPVELDAFGQPLWPQNTLQHSTWGWSGFSGDSFRSPWSPEDDRARRARRVDPDYLTGTRRF